MLGKVAVVLRFSLLGPLEVHDGAVPVQVSGTKLRTLLSVLLLHANQPVPPGTLQAALWGTDPPRSVGTSLPNHVARLRRLLGDRDGDRVETVRGGYRIKVADGELDVTEFAAFVRSAQDARARQDWPEVIRRAVAAEDLWRGTPLAAEPVDVLAPHVQKLVTTRVEALEWHIDAALRLDRLEGLASRLAGLVEEYPLSETLTVQYMRVLHRTGRRAQALDAFQRLRRTLVKELGIEPSASTQQAQRRILAADEAEDEEQPRTSPAHPGPAETASEVIGTSVPLNGFQRHILTTASVAPEEPIVPRRPRQPSRPVPRQLPAAPRFFVGRAEPIEALSQAAARGEAVIAVVGAGGIGKTALALSWAHRMAADFPDGQLYLDLHGFSPGGWPVAPADALAALLQALGGADGPIPTDFAARAALYRTLAADRRLLIVLDNAADSEQVRALLPGGSGCLTVVTSRNRLAALVATAGAQPVRLDPLDADEAGELFRARLGPARVADDADAFCALAAACAGFPLALALIAARLALEPDLLPADLARQLRDDRRRLSVLGIAETAVDLRDVFSWSRRQLSPAAARLFLTLGLHPGTSAPMRLAALLADLPRDTADTASRELAAAHLALLTADGRILFHDLIHLYAAESADAELDDEDRRGIRQRMFDYYALSVFAANQLVHPTRSVVPFPGRTGHGAHATAEVFEDVMGAAAWLDRERDVLVAVSAQADEAGEDATAWWLAWSLTVSIDRRGDWQAQVELQERALRAAERMDRADLRAWTHRELATAHWRLGRLPAAKQHLAGARDLWCVLDDHAGLARVYRAWSLVCESEQDYPAALAHAYCALSHARAAGDAAEKGMALATVAWHCAMCGDYQAALTHAGEAVRIHDEIGYPVGAAYALDTMGMASQRLGLDEDAVRYYNEAAERFEEGGERYYLAQTLLRVAEVHRSMGDEELAGARCAAARAIVDGLSVPRTDPIRALLDPSCSPDPG